MTALSILCNFIAAGLEAMPESSKVATFSILCGCCWCSFFFSKGGSFTGLSIELSLVLTISPEFPRANKGVVVALLSAPGDRSSTDSLSLSLVALMTVSSNLMRFVSCSFSSISKSISSSFLSSSGVSTNLLNKWKRSLDATRSARQILLALDVAATSAWSGRRASPISPSSSFTSGRSDSGEGSECLW